MRPVMRQMVVRMLPAPCCLVQTQDGNPTSGVCHCAPGYGDYGCELQLTSLSNGQNLTISQLPGADFAWWQVTVRGRRGHG